MTNLNTTTPAAVPATAPPAQRLSAIIARRLTKARAIAYLTVCGMDGDVEAARELLIFTARELERLVQDAESECAD